MNPATTVRPDGDEQGEELIQRLILEAGDPAVAPRGEFVAALRARMLECLGPPRRPPRGPSRWAIGSGLAALTLAAATLGLPLLRPRDAWADVAQALRGCRWIHARAVGPGGVSKGESWFSPVVGVLASRDGSGIEFHDLAARTFERYVPAEGLYRLPEDRDRRDQGVALFGRLLDPNGPTASPLPGMDIITQRRRIVVEAGREWPEIEMTLRGDPRDGEHQLRFRVDPRSNLPVSCAFRTPEGPTATILYDYPDRGPADVFAIGAPRDARVIDRLPAAGLDRVLAGLKAGRTRFDDYRGLMDWGDGMTAKRIWRKGRKWRVDALLPLAKDPTPIPGDADAAWWKAHQADFPSLVEAVCDGSRVDYFRFEGNPYRDGASKPPAVRLVSTQALAPSDDPPMPWPDHFPEYLGHPQVYQQTADRDLALIPKPADGPPGAILLRVFGTRPADAGCPDLHKLWIDPARQYLVIRSETCVFDPAGPPKVAYIDERVVLATARSPTGSAYPTRIRRTTSDSEGTQVWSYHLDFEAEIPDELFHRAK